MIVNRIFKAAHGRAATMGATIMLTFQRNGIGFGFWFCPPYPPEQPAKTRIAYNGPRVYEPARRAQAVAPLFLCNRRDRRAGCRRPADDQREEACVNPLLAAVVASVLASGPATDGRAANHLDFKDFPPD